MRTEWVKMTDGRAARGLLVTGHRGEEWLITEEDHGLEVEVLDESGDGLQAAGIPIGYMDVTNEEVCGFCRQARVRIVLTDETVAPASGRYPILEPEGGAVRVVALGGPESTQSS